MDRSRSHAHERMTTIRGARRRAVTFLVAAPLLAATLAVGCNGEEEADGTVVARTYAPELNVNLDRMERLESGLLYEDVVEGTGEEAVAGRLVTVHYTGWLSDGTRFDSSREHGQPFEVPIGQGHVIRGWDEGIPGMRVGGQRKLVIPPVLGYGERGVPGTIPAGATLVFDVELLDVH
jgi:FKBP-type peptidyl-prolyl cis-trans isomerase FkpA